MKKILSSPITTVVAFALAAILLLFSTIGGARAVFVDESDFYKTRFRMYDIGVTLAENGEDRAWRNYVSADNGNASGAWNQADPVIGTLLGDMTGKDDKGNALPVQLEHAYDEVITAKNTGQINEYVRITIYRYWLDRDGNKLTTLTPDLIRLNFLEGGKWVRDPDTPDTAERCIFYYTDLLPVGGETDPLTDTLTIDGSLAKYVTTNEMPTADGSGKVIKKVYDYDGVQFVVEAQVDAVQEHNAKDAILSACGLNVDVDDNGGPITF